MKRVAPEGIVETKGGEPYRVRKLTLEASGYSDEVLLAALADVAQRLTGYTTTTNTVLLCGKRRPKKNRRSRRQALASKPDVRKEGA